MNNTKLYTISNDGTHRLYYNSWKYNGGEIGVRLNLRNMIDENGKTITISSEKPDSQMSVIPDEIHKIVFESKLINSDSIMELLMLKNAVDVYFNTFNPVATELQLGYFPYGRQDRKAESGDPRATKVMSNMVNSMSFDTVVIKDPHSDVVENLIDNVVIIDKATIFDQIVLSEHGIDINNMSFLIAPDQGAQKSVYKYNKSVANPLTVLTANKERDTHTGDINGISLYQKDTSIVGDAVIMDDICDGGRTFIELAKHIRNEHPNIKNLHLWVTHGIFAKGLDELKKYYTSIVTTSSFPHVGKLKTEQGNKDFLTII